jgi:hypothetical protein
MPTTPRLWVQIKSGIRPETDAEYLVRLRERARRRANQPQSPLRTPPLPAAAAFERPLLRRVLIGFVSDLVDGVGQFFAARCARTNATAASARGAAALSRQ